MEAFTAHSSIFHQLLQGANDVVVHPVQAESIVKAIQSRNGRVEYVLFEGEGHGWRKNDTIKAAFEKELAFFMDVLQLKEVDSGA